MSQVGLELGEGSEPIETSSLSGPLRGIIEDIQSAWETAKTPLERVSLRNQTGVCIRLQIDQETTTVELPNLNCYSHRLAKKEVGSLARRNTEFQKQLAQSLGIFDPTETSWIDFLRQRNVVMVRWDRVTEAERNNPNRIIGVAETDRKKGDPDCVTHVPTKYPEVYALIDFRQTAGATLSENSTHQLPHPLPWYIESGQATPTIRLEIPTNLLTEPQKKGFDL